MKPAGIPIKQEIIDSFNLCEFAQLLGMSVSEVWDHGVRVAMITEGKAGPNGVAHGGAVFTLADHAFGIAANMGGERQVALSATIQYISPASGHLEAIAERISGNDLCSLYRVTVSAGDRLVAVFEGIGIKVP
ncbi:MAG: PaaI family thioesterase [Methanomicrobiales archaeon]